MSRFNCVFHICLNSIIKYEIRNYHSSISKIRIKFFRYIHWKIHLFLFLFTDPLGLEKSTHSAQSKQCPDCSATFETRFKLFQHRIKECKSNRNREVTIEKRTSSGRISKAADRDFNPDINNTCMSCNETFKSPHALNQHKRFDCSSSVLALTHKQTFLRCGCGSHFASLEILKAHKMKGTCSNRQRHDGSFKQFYCVGCKNEFSTLSNLKRHKIRCPFGKDEAVLTTTKKIRVACPHCGVTFSQRSNLARHQKQVKCWEKLQHLEKSRQQLGDQDQDSEMYDDSDWTANYPNEKLQCKTYSNNYDTHYHSDRNLVGKTCILS